MRNPIALIAVMFSLAIMACQPEPKPIDYGTDVCNHCKMTIVDKKFAAQAVTDKGKVYNFDAIECLVPFVNEKSNTEFAFLQINSYLKPDQRVNARDAYYVKNPEIPSPMGGFLSAYADKSKAQERADHPEAKVLNWKQLNQELLQ